jgi:predicted DNA-binding transcriptional regulator AlpA
MAEPIRWLNRASAAQHLDMKRAAFNRALRYGLLPQPNLQLGVRSPRWRSDTLDSAMGADKTPREKTREAVDAVAAEIRQGAALRNARPSRRQR